MKQKQDLQKIYETSSPQASCKGQQSPRRIARNRVMANTMGASYLTYFKIDSKSDMQQIERSRNIKKPSQKQETLEQKNNRIQTLQQAIMKQTTKMKARERAFDRRVKHDWTNQIFQIFIGLTAKCGQLSKDSIVHKRKVLKLVTEMSHGDHKSKVKLLFNWVLEWVHALLSSLSVQIRKIL